MQPNLLADLLSRDDGGKTPIGRAAKEVRQIAGSLDIVTTAPTVSAMALELRNAPLRILGPALGHIEQQPLNRWVEFETGGACVGLLVGRNPGNPRHIELAHFQRHRGQRISLLKLGAAWTGIENAPAIDWAAVLARSPATDPAADQVWSKKVERAVRVAPAFGSPVTSEKDKSPILSILLLDLAVLAMLSSGLVKTGMSGFMRNGQTTVVSGVTGQA